ncbi:uncharacterized protein N7482_009900 [Penicillium canariense]|uniref:Uncharacterized protein n=1 Tax=Penicillium canariense TaxID=189055 RepID=A0A9W9HQE3_9EURO|nr:uncharacterized protein N7482_009900 [Penicillium canariense]KAJ5153422.1 hypothetical protein N7482_009900 [Penicillium canariense]
MPDWSDAASHAHGIINAGVKIEGAYATHQWNKAKVAAAREGAKYPDGKPRVNQSAQYDAANPTLKNLDNNKDLYERANGK